MLVEKSIQIKGKNQLTGEIEISGAKNAVLKQMILPILCEGQYKIENVPNIADVFYMQDVLGVLGITSNLEGKTLEIVSPNDISVEAPYEIVQKMRASIIVLGPLLARKGEAKIAFPGGDQLGPRPVKMHIEALEKMGASFELDHLVVVVKDLEKAGTELAPVSPEGEGNFFVPWKTGHWMIYPGAVWHRPGVVQSLNDRYIVAADMEF